MEAKIFSLPFERGFALFDVCCNESNNNKKSKIWIILRRPSWLRWYNIIMNKEILKQTLINTLGAVGYIFLISQLMRSGDKLFGQNSVLVPFIVLLLFSLSAAVVGGLVLGSSIILFFENKKSDSIRAAIYSVGWLAFYTAIGIIALIIVK